VEGVELSAEDRDAQFRFELDLLLRSTAVGAGSRATSCGLLRLRALWCQE